MGSLATAWIRIYSGDSLLLVCPFIASPTLIAGRWNPAWRWEFV